MRRLIGSLAAVLAVLAVAAPAGHAQADPNAGPGGPILIAGGSDGFGRFYPEILRAEGMNEFAVANVAALDPAALSGYQVVVLASTALSPAQAAMFSDWVTAGGNLIAMRPDPDLAGLLGLGSDTGDLANGYLGVDPAGLGGGVTAETMQYHGVADRWTLAGATQVAALYANATAAAGNPAVTVRSVGAAGGQAAAFAYDLARSVVYTRQGNPAWTGDRNADGIPRSNDLFFGTAQTDWVDPAKAAIPQADEQQRLLANLITRMNADRTPLPRFWYLPRGLSAAVVMTGDDHGSNAQNTGTNIQFNAFANASPPGCSVADWQCVRGTSYVYPGTPVRTPRASSSRASRSRSISSRAARTTPTRSSRRIWNQQLAAFGPAFPGVVAPRTNRTHCIAWNGYTNDARIERSHGIRLDTNYYYWPGTWMPAPGQNFPRPGLFTGSGFPMRFANEDGSLVDVYQAATQITDEWGPTKQESRGVATAIDALLARAVGPQEYYAVVTANMHTDGPPVAPHPGAAQIVAAAKAYGVPVVSAAQMLDWLDGRNSSAFQNVRARRRDRGVHRRRGRARAGPDGHGPARRAGRRAAVAHRERRARRDGEPRRQGRGVRDVRRGERRLRRELPRQRRPGRPTRRERRSGATARSRA